MSFSKRMTKSTNAIEMPVCGAGTAICKTGILKFNECAEQKWITLTDHCINVSVRVLTSCVRC